MAADPITRLNTALQSHYRIERELGEGGMAMVYLADDLKHERKVALKVLKPELAAVVGAERFLAEIKTTANLQHPHVLPLFDSGEADGFLFYVMPYVEGESLRERLDRERQLRVDEAVRIATDVAEALQAAHEQGVIHRDIKPANILLSRGRPLVADFGIALALSAAGGGRLTETGLSIGTPYYMSPEQASADRDPSPASDVYSLGCVLYEMLVGDPPHTASSAQAVLAKILTEEAQAPASIRTSIPENVDAAVRKALEKLPADRFSDANDLARALADPGFKHGAEATGTAVSQRSGWGMFRAGAGMIVALISGFVAAGLLAPEPTERLTRFTVSSPRGTVLSGIPALSPDGEWLAFVAEGSDGPTLFRRRRGELEAEAIRAAEGRTEPFFSPDSRWLGFHSGGRLLKVPIAGGPAAPIAETGTVGAASWGDDGVIVFIDAATGQLYTVPGDGGVPEPVGGRSEGMMFGSVWALPGGGSTLATLRRGGGPDTRMVVIDLDTGAADTLGFATRVSHAPGHLVYSASDGTLLAQPFDAEARRSTGPSAVLVDGVALGSAGLGMFAISEEGTLAYQGERTDSDSLVIVGRDGVSELSLSERGNLEDPAFSPDGRRIAMGLREVGENEHIWILDRDQGTAIRRLTIEGLRNMYPVWTPDGARIAFMSHRGGAPGRIYWQSAEGSGAAEILFASDYPTGPGSWSPNGRTLAFWAGRNGSTDIGLLDRGDSTPRWVVESEFDDTQPQFSPDGLWLAYTSNRSGAPEVYVTAVSGGGGQVQVSFGGGHSPRWASGRDVLNYASGSMPGTILAASYTAEGGFRVTSREEAFSLDDEVDRTLPGTMNYDVHGGELVHVHDAVGAGAKATELVWVLNWPEIVR